jgi:hypothetical protein
MLVVPVRFLLLGVTVETTSKLRVLLRLWGWLPETLVVAVE